jgi:hypothetical protein
MFAPGGGLTRSQVCFAFSVSISICIGIIQLPKLRVQDAGYATAYVRLQVLAPEIAAFLPKQGEVNHTGHTHAVSGAGPTRTYSRPFSCYFCADPGHRVMACLLLLEYIKIVRVVWIDRKLCFSGKDGEKVPFNPDGLKIEVDKRYGWSCRFEPQPWRS